MREFVSYLWAQQFFEDAAIPPSGKRVFTAKHCATCHNDPSSGAPKITGVGRSFSAITMVSVLWHHGPRMLDQMKSQGHRVAALRRRRHGEPDCVSEPHKSQFK